LAIPHTFFRRLSYFYRSFSRLMPPAFPYALIITENACPAQGLWPLILLFKMQLTLFFAPESDKIGSESFPDLPVAHIKEASI
jgi:hypothetical protein